LFHLLFGKIVSKSLNITVAEKRQFLSVEAMLTIKSYSGSNRYQSQLIGG